MGTQPCPFCGAGLDGRPDFCPTCGNYLDWGSAELTRPQEPVGTAEWAPPRADRPAYEQTWSAGQADQVPTLTVTERHVAVEPGGTQAVVLSVLNNGAQVDEIDIVVDPPVGTFTSVDQPAVNLYPHDKAEIRVTFAPPRDPRIPAGRHEWTIRAASRVSGRLATASGTVEVLPFTAEEAELEPRQTSGWRTTFEHAVTLHNGGNVPWVALLEPARSDRLSLTANPAGVTVPAGAVGTATVRGHARRRVIGTGESIPLHLEVVSAPGPGAPRRPIALDATRYQRALLPMWLLTTAVVVLGLGIAAYAVLRGPADDGVLVPSVRTLTAAEATLALQRAGFQVEPRSVQSTLDAGMAVETSPAEGQSAPEGSTVTLFVSSGPPAGKVQVPPVVALTREEAERRLLDLGLIPRFATAFSDDVPAGEVIRSEPASPAEVNAGSEVVVFVSDGPEPTPTQTTPEPTMTEPTTTPPPELPDPGFETVARPLDPTRGVLTVTTVRDGENTDFDRVVLEATGPLDGYEVDYDDLGFLIVSIEKVTAGDLPPVVTGLNRVAGYIVETDPGAETLRLTIETPFQGPFRAFTVPAEPAEGQPERLVVDVFDP